MSTQTTTTFPCEPPGSRARTESADRPGSPAVTTAGRSTPVPSLVAIPKLNDKGRMADIPLSPEARSPSSGAARSS
jgi:hypothetical protein